jgi:Zn-dependent M16 (insulinase) family peptidase
MNAMTGPDYTMYPFSTVNPVDYNNLLKVYLDAVFHPLLRERDFLQEGHRLELDNAKQLYIKGVVYNEMKGALANPASYFYSKLSEYALSGTSYAHVLGGCPLHIPDLTHKELVEFQHRHYHPTNSTLVTYGDMDPTAHMKTMNDILSKFDVGERVSIPLLASIPAGRGVVVDHGPPDPMGEASKSTRIVVSWVMPSHLLQGTMESVTRTTVYLNVLSHLLVDGPASPMYKALIDTHLGSDFAPANGLDAEFRNPLFSFGVQGVDSTKVTEKEVTEAVTAALKSSIEEGFPHERVDGIIHQSLLSKRNRSSNFGLGIACGGVVNSVHADDVFTLMQTTKILEELRREHERNPRYFSQIIQSLLIDNKPQVTLVLHSDEKHMEKRKATEDERLKTLQATLTAEITSNILKTSKDLEEAQKEKQDVSVLPTLLRSDIQPNIIPEQRGTVVNLSMNTIECIVAPCNRLIYTNVFIPISLDKFSKEEVLLLPTYCDLLCEVGAGEFDYEQLTTAKDLVCSGFKSSLHLGTPADITETICGVYLSFYALPDRHADAMKLLQTILNKVKFDATDDKVMTRAFSLISAQATSVVNSVPSRGHALAMIASAARASHVVSLLDTFEGLHQVRFQNTLRDEVSAEGQQGQNNVRKVIESLKSIHEKVKQFRGQVWSVCEEGDKTTVTDRMRGFVENVFTDRAAIGHNALPDLGFITDLEPKKLFIPTPGEVSFVGAAFSTRLPTTDPKAAALQVGLKILSNELLHLRVREQGGAYGSGATSAPGGFSCGVTGMYSYRDPAPTKTVEVMMESCKFLSDRNAYEDRHIDEALLGIFGAMDAPRMPSSYGRLWYLHRLDNATRQQYRDRLLGVTRDDVKNTAGTLIAQQPHFVILGDEGTIPDESWKKVQW